jgi:hypothetical protein
VCIGDQHSEVYKPPGSDALNLTVTYIERLMGRLKGYVEDNSDSSGHILRLATYICLVRLRFKDHQFTPENYQVMFKAFDVCSQMLLDDASLSAVPMDGEMKAKACEALKMLVINFFDLKWQGEEKSRGNWIYVIPFIHCWDLPDRKDTDWLQLDKWKAGILFRYFIFYKPRFDCLVGIFFL